MSAMQVSTRSFGGFVLVASGAVLGAVLLSQYWGGLEPCELCLMERWPWDAALVVALVAVVVGGRDKLRWLALGLAVLFAAGSALAFYHVGVELHWFAGPTACTAGNTSAASIEELRKQILGHQAVPCDQSQWSLFGVSLAGWNFLASLAMVIVCLGAARRAR
ncbi:MAG TPA: disulfide bond formation protein B [Stellaceae bacterium]|nr:disulfide bond formation protein B [Stellaceae bacterium]